MLFVPLPIVRPAEGAAFPIPTLPLAKTTSGGLAEVPTWSKPEGLVVPIPTLPLVKKAALVALEKVCVPVQIGPMDGSNAGAASERMAVVAVPFIAVKPILALGLANPAKLPGKSPD